jgi:hypothetical protein
MPSAFTNATDRRIGRPRPRLFDAAPSDTEWQAQLAGQTRITVSARTALDTVRAAWPAAAKIPDTSIATGISAL